MLPVVECIVEVVAIVAAATERTEVVVECVELPGMSASGLCSMY